MLQNLTGWHALIILAIVVLIFGAAKLPALAKSLGQSMRILKNETRDETADPAPVNQSSAEPERPVLVDERAPSPHVSAVPRTASESVGA